MKYNNIKRYKFSTILKNFNALIVKSFNTLGNNFLKIFKFIDLKKYDLKKIYKYLNIRKFNFTKITEYFDPGTYNIRRLKENRIL